MTARRQYINFLTRPYTEDNTHHDQECRADIAQIADIGLVEGVIDRVDVDVGTPSARANGLTIWDRLRTSLAVELKLLQTSY